MTMTVQQILDDCGVPYDTEGRYCREGWLQLQCPWCGGGTDPEKPYMGIPLAGNVANCWFCGKHNILQTLVKLTKLSFKELRDRLGRGNAYEQTAPKIGHLQIPFGVGPLQYAHGRYLMDRGFDWLSLSGIWDVQGIGMNPSGLQWRIFIPIYFNGKIVSWSTRSIVDDKPDRYIAAKPEQEDMLHKDLLFGEDYARNTVVVVEGELDAMAIGPGAVATFGTGYTYSQVLRISKYPIRAICFDPEKEAQTVASKLCDELMGFPGKTYQVQLDAGKDPAACLKTESGKKQLKELRKRFLEV